jgi:hypothetical protein
MHALQIVLVRFAKLWFCDSKKGAGRPIVRTKEVKEVVDDIL